MLEVNQQERGQGHFFAQQEEEDTYKPQQISGKVRRE